MRVWQVCMLMREESKQAIEAVADTILKGWNRDTNTQPLFAIHFVVLYFLFLFSLLSCVCVSE